MRFSAQYTPHFSGVKATDPNHSQVHPEILLIQVENMEGTGRQGDGGTTMGYPSFYQAKGWGTTQKI